MNCQQLSKTICFALLSTLFIVSMLGGRAECQHQQHRRLKDPRQKTMVPCNLDDVVPYWKRDLMFCVATLVCVGISAAAYLVIYYVQKENRRLIDIIHNQYYETLSRVLNYGQATDGWEGWYSGGVNETQEWTETEQANRRRASAAAAAGRNWPQQFPTSGRRWAGGRPGGGEMGAGEQKTDRVYDITEQRTEGSLQQKLKKERKDYETAKMKQMKVLMDLEAQGGGLPAAVPVGIGQQNPADNNQIMLAPLVLQPAYKPDPADGVVGTGKPEEKGSSFSKEKSQNKSPHSNQPGNEGVSEPTRSKKALKEKE